MPNDEIIVCYANLAYSPSIAAYEADFCFEVFSQHCKTHTHEGLYLMVLVSCAYKYV